MLSATCMQVPATTTTTTTAPAGVALGATDPCVASAGIVGGSGYTGALLAELLLRHPSVKLAAVSSETFAGQSVQQHLPRLRSDLASCSQADLAAWTSPFSARRTATPRRSPRSCSTTASR